MEIDDILDLDDFDDEPKEEKKKPKREKTPMRYHTIRAQEMYEKKRFYSEKALLDNFEWHLKDGCVYCIISGGDVDQLTFLKLVIRNPAAQVLPSFFLVFRHRGRPGNRPMGKEGLNQAGGLLHRRNRPGKLRDVHQGPLKHSTEHRRPMRGL